MNLFNKIVFYYLGGIAIAGFILMFGLSMFWQYWPYPESDYLTFRYPKNVILNPGKIIHPGDIIQYSADTIVRKPFTAVTSRYLISNDLGCDYKILPTTTMVLKAGPIVFTNKSYIVPLDFKPCTYHLHFVTTVQVNPNRTITFLRDTEDFIVQ